MDGLCVSAFVKGVKVEFVGRLDSHRRRKFTVSAPYQQPEYPRNTEYFALGLQSGTQSPLSFIVLSTIH
ncbi:MAG: hypothetical protein ACLUKN_03705 [Bacilli bacterium]